MGNIQIMDLLLVIIITDDTYKALFDATESSCI